MAPTAANSIKFYFGTSAQFSTATKNADSLYFLTDTKQVYLGGDLYSGSVELLGASDEFPASPSQGILYCKPSTHEVKMWNGTAWEVIVPEVVSEIVEEGASATANTALANVGAIKDYVADKIGAAYTITKEATAETGFLATYKLYKGNTAVGDAINIPKDFLVKSASLKVCETAGTPVTVPALAVGDPYLDFVINTKESPVTDEHIYINVKGLVEFPTVDDTSTVDLTIDGNKKITADVKVSSAANNIISINSVAGSEGLFAEQYIDSKADTNSVALTVTGKTLTADAKVSANTGNKVQIANDGLFVAADYIGSIEDTATVDLNVDANAKLTAAVKVSATANNIISAEADGIFAQQYIDSVMDGTTVDLTVTGKALTAEVIRSAVADNILEQKNDGLYATLKWNTIA